MRNAEWGMGLRLSSTLPIQHSPLINLKLRRRDLVEPLAQFAPQRIGPSDLLWISVAFGKRVEPVERKASRNRVL